MNQTPRLNLKDIINIAIFTVLFIITTFVFATVLGMSAYTYYYYAGLSAIPCGIIFIYLRLKVRKFGVLTILGVLSGAIYVAMGSQWTFLVGYSLAGLLADLITKIGDYKRPVTLYIGYLVFQLTAFLGNIGMLIFAANDYRKTAISSGMTVSYIDTMIHQFTGVMLPVVFIVTALGATIGAWLGLKTMSKHFKKIGLL